MLAYKPPAHSEVSQLTKTGSRWAVTQLVLRQIMGLGFTAILARLVTPADFGLVAMGTIIVQFLNLFDTGMSWATVNEREVEDTQIRSLFWMAVFWGTALWVIMAAAGPVMASYFRSDAIEYICPALGAVLFLNSLAIQPIALTKRRIRQDHLAKIELVSLLSGGLSGVVVAFLFQNYWALIVQVVAAALVRTSCAFLFSGFNPKGPLISRSALPFLKSGGYMALCNYVNYFQLYSDNIFVGRYCGPSVMGEYSRAYYLRTVPSMYAAMSVTDVMVGSLSALSDNVCKMGNSYRKAVAAVSFIGCPLAVMLGINAEEVVKILYGPAWGGVVPVLIWLMIPAVTLPLYQTAVWLFIACRKGKEQLVMSLLITPIVVAAFYWAAHYGPVTVAKAGAALFTVPLPAISLWYAHRVAGLRLSETLRPVIPILLGCLLMAVCGIGVGSALHGRGTDWWIVMAARVIVSGSVYLTTCRILYRELPLEIVERMMKSIGLSRGSFRHERE